jgi:NDP-sugar pyrophosphorylase family protein
MCAGIRDILLISTPQDTPRFFALPGDGSQWGLTLQYAVQPSTDGLAQAFPIGRSFIAGQPSTLILGDNIFHGHDLPKQLERADANADGATVFAYHVHDPERYGVVDFDASFRALSIEEKPAKPRRTTRSRGSASTTSTCATSPPASGGPRAANWRSPTSTAATSRAASSTSRSWGAVSRGSTPARTIR